MTAEKCAGLSVMKTAVAADKHKEIQKAAITLVFLADKSTASRKTWQRQEASTLALSASKQSSRSKTEGAGSNCLPRLCTEVGESTAQEVASKWQSIGKLVGAPRFERGTPCAQGRCATRLRYAPTEPSSYRARRLLERGHRRRHEIARLFERRADV